MQQPWSILLQPPFLRDLPIPVFLLQGPVSYSCFRIAWPSDNQCISMYRSRRQDGVKWNSKARLGMRQLIDTVITNRYRDHPIAAGAQMNALTKKRSRPETVSDPRWARSSRVPPKRMAHLLRRHEYGRVLPRFMHCSFGEAGECPLLRHARRSREGRLQALQALPAGQAPAGRAMCSQGNAGLPYYRRSGNGPGPGKTGSAGWHEPLSFSSHVQTGHRADTEAICSREKRKKGAR